MLDRRQVLLSPSCRVRGPRRTKGVSCWMLVCLAFQLQVCRSHARAEVLGANIAAGMWDNRAQAAAEADPFQKEKER